MKMNDPLQWQISGAAQAFSSMVAAGEAIEITNAAGKRLCGEPVAVEATTYDRLVAWDGEAERQHGIRLEEAHRLERMLDACSGAASDAGGCFVCKAVDARGSDGRCERHVLTMSNYGKAGEPIWLIHL